MMHRVLEECLKPSLAHVRRNDDGSFAIHELEEQLCVVGNLAGEFASTFGCLELEGETWGHKYDKTL
jgi:hypothetical protein